MIRMALFLKVVVGIFAHDEDNDEEEKDDDDDDDEQSRDRVASSADLQLTPIALWDEQTSSF